MLIMNNFQRLADQSLSISSRAHIVSSWNRTARCLQLLSFIVGNYTERVLEIIKLLIKRILK